MSKLKCRWCNDSFDEHEMYITKLYENTATVTKTCLICKARHTAMKIEARIRRRESFVNRWNSMEWVS